MSKQVQFETELSIDELKKLQRLAKQRKMSLDEYVAEILSEIAHD